jgi:Lrp/AsnC family transcriptional regulator
MVDAIDRKILRQLQQDASLSIGELAERVSLSPNACWRRVKMLEQAGVIARRVAILDANKLGLSLTAFVSVRAAEHSDEWLKGFVKAVSQIPEVVEFYRMTGEIDYLLKIRIADIASYDAVYRRLIRSAKLADVSASFAMEEIKATTALPV